MTHVTQILAAVEAGDPKAAAELLPLVYEELRKLAAARLAAEKPGQTFQATALVFGALLGLRRICQSSPPSRQSRLEDRDGQPRGSGRPAESPRAVALSGLRAWRDGPLSAGLRRGKKCQAILPAIGAGN